MLLKVAYVEEPGDVESWLGIVHIGIIFFWIILPNWSLELFVLYLVLVLPLCACICVDVFVEVLVLHMAPDGHETMALESQLGALWRYVWENSPRKKRCAAWLQTSRWFFWLFHGVSVIFCSVHRSVSHSRRVATKTAPKDCILDARVQRSILSMPTNTYMYFGNVANQKHEFRANVVLNQRSSWATWLVLRPKLASAHPTSSTKFPPTPKWSDFYPLGKKTLQNRVVLVTKRGLYSSPKLAASDTM